LIRSLGSCEYIGNTNLRKLVKLGIILIPLTY